MAEFQPPVQSEITEQYQMPAWLGEAGMTVLDILADDSVGFSSTLLTRRSRDIPLTGKDVIRVSQVRAKTQNVEQHLFSIQINMAQENGTSHLMKLSWGVDDSQYQSAFYESRWVEETEDGLQKRVTNEKRDQFDGEDRENIQNLLKTAIEKCGIVRNSEFFANLRSNND